MVADIYIQSDQTTPWSALGAKAITIAITKLNINVSQTFIKGKKVNVWFKCITRLREIFLCRFLFVPNVAAAYTCSNARHISTVVFPKRLLKSNPTFVKMYQARDMIIEYKLR